MINRKAMWGIIAVAIMALVLSFWGASVFAAHPNSDVLKMPGVQVRTPDLVQAARKSDVSAPLSTLKPVPPLILPQNVREHESGGPANPRLARSAAAGRVVDSALQSILGPLVMPTPIANFEGMFNEYGPIPPDTNGDIGRNEYIQIVNSGFAIYNKTGTLLYGPANNNTLFLGFGGICESTNSGDPVALYDPMADRWVLNWFTGASNPTHQCFAVSTSGNPLGSWYRYDFVTSPTQTAFEDYPHLGVWPDAYYMTTNEFGGPNGGGNYAFDRVKMLRGDASALMIYIGSGDSGLLPSDFDGSILPPAGSPNYFFEWFDTTHLAQYKFHADFVTPGNSTFTGPFQITVPAFNYPTCGNSREQCVPQPGTTAQLEVIGDRLMYRVAYRNFGGYESIVLNHTVNATGGNPGIAAPRWYELRAPNGASGATLQQAGTFYPGDGLYRWMGSVAQDSNGDIAMGFSASNSTNFPSIRYAGRIPSDAPGTFGQGEAVLFAGTGSEDFPTAPRWGDYSDLTVDPVDDCTFWYTTEYFAQTGLRDWRSRIGSFKFPQCTAQGSPTPVASATAIASPTNTPGATATLCAGSITATGSITNTDGTQTGRLGLGDPKSSCAVPKAVSALSDALTRHYDVYNYTNSTGASQCVTVSIVQNCGNNAVQSAAYLGTFNPANPQTNYLADGGASGHSFSYSFSLPAGQTAAVVVVEVSPNLGCSTYNITINPCGAGTATPTSPPTTPSVTSTPAPVTPSATPTVVCVGTTYQTFASANATMIPATDDTGNHCDDCTTVITLPFTVDVYGTPYASVFAGSNGMLDFGVNQANIYTNNCLPVRANAPAFSGTLFAYYDDLRTDVMTGTHGIYSATIGTAPNREFVLRWQATYFYSDTVDTNFEVVLHENSPTLSVIYGQTGPVSPTEAQPSAGIQLNLGQYTSYICHTTIPVGTKVDYVPIGCGITPTPTPNLATATRTVTPQPTACAITFNDVPVGSTFYDYIRCLACRGIVGGYPCGGPGEPCPGNYYRPNNNVTRGQVSKIVSESAGFADAVPSTQRTFEDVPPSSTFWLYIERLSVRSIVSGYPCGGPFEPCVSPTNRPYFRPNNNVTRGQLSKITSGAAGWTETPTSQTFQDAPPGSTFYVYIERMASRGIISGYPCGSNAFEPCVAPGNRPYFRPNNNATRGQMAKIAAAAFFPNCATPAKR